MQDSIKNKTDLIISPKKYSKAEAQEALSDINDELRNLCQIQGRLAELSNSDPSNQELLLTRISVFTETTGKLVDMHIKLTALLFSKQGGGRPLNKHFNLAYGIVKQHYKDTKKIIKFTTLSKEVNLALGKEKNSIDGTFDFPERNASDCITLFKICLPHESF
jgi:hypothetical protein